MHVIPTVLVVNDAAVNGEPYYTVLAVKYRILTVESNAEALTLLTGGNIDLILLNKPNDGIALCEKIRFDLDQKELPILVVLDSTDSEQRDAYTEAGMDDYICAPVDIEELMIRLRSMLRLKSYHDPIRHLESTMSLGSYDPVTQLPNRELLIKKFMVLLQETSANARGIAVLCIGINGIGALANTLGTQINTRLLQEIATDLKKCVRAGDLVARISEEAFAILITGVQAREPDPVLGMAQRIQSELQKLCSIGDHELYITPALGISFYPDHGDSAELLLTHAATAMTYAKKVGKESAQIFAANIKIHVKEQVTLEGELRRALERDEFRLRYHPKFELLTGQITGVEALLSWHHPNRGLLPAGKFIQTVETSGLMEPVGEWVLHTACEQHRSWANQGIKVNVAVNLSARQFRNRRMVDTIARILQKTGMEGEWLELELNENMLMHESSDDGADIITMLNALKGLGVRISIDDFGTGYSSLFYLKRFPVDALKIDRMFIGDLLESIHNATITKAIIDLAHNLKLKVIAEGVETEAQKAFLQGWKCDEAQGYLFSQPLVAEDFEQYWWHYYNEVTAAPLSQVV
jgi:diguanylate cyclase (GGDEF)-like protein